MALQDLTLSLEEGRTLVVFGPNGAGKSTLLRVLATLLRPHAGSARVLGRDLPGDGWAVRGQDRASSATSRCSTASSRGARTCAIPRALFGIDGGRVEELLERVGMERRADEPVRTLSRGMVQRLAICRATLHEPELLLLDEPLANLDPAAIELVSPLVHGQTRVVTSHDPERGLHDADVALGLRGGRPAFLAPAGDVDAPAIRELYR